MPYPERIIPDETPPGPRAIHEKRYLFARAWCDGKRVLDGACGVGYGSAILAERAASVLGVDVDEEAIAYARAHYGRPNVEYRVADLLAPGLDDAVFDVFCSFETLEHVPDRDTFLANATRVLRDDGVFVVSTPRAERTTTTPDNPYHHVEYDRADFEALVARYFHDVEIYGQRRLQTARHRLLKRLDVLGLRRRFGALRSLGKLATGTEPMSDVTLDGIAIDRDHLDEADVLVAVCRSPLR